MQHSSITLSLETLKGALPAYHRMKGRPAPLGGNHNTAALQIIESLEDAFGRLPDWSHLGDRFSPVGDGDRLTFPHQSQ